MKNSKKSLTNTQDDAMLRIEQQFIDRLKKKAREVGYGKFDVKDVLVHGGFMQSGFVSNKYERV